MGGRLCKRSQRRKSSTHTWTESWVPCLLPFGIVELIISVPNNALSPNPRRRRSRCLSPPLLTLSFLLSSSLLSKRFPWWIASKTKLRLCFSLCLSSHLLCCSVVDAQPLFNLFVYRMSKDISFLSESLSSVTDDFTRKVIFASIFHSHDFSLFNLEIPVFFLNKRIFSYWKSRWTVQQRGGEVIPHRQHILVSFALTIWSKMAQSMIFILVFTDFKLYFLNNPS